MTAVEQQPSHTGVSLASQTIDAIAERGHDMQQGMHNGQVWGEASSVTQYTLRAQRHCHVHKGIARWSDSEGQLSSVHSFSLHAHTLAPFQTTGRSHYGAALIARWC